MSAHRIVTVPTLAPPVGYAHGVIASAGELLFLGGQTALDPQGQLVGDTLVAQFDQAAGNVAAVLSTAGCAPADLVSMQVFVTDIDEYKASLAELGRVWRTHFGARYPAMGLFGVTRLFDHAAKVELVAIAVRPEGSQAGEH